MQGMLYMRQSILPFPACGCLSRLAAAEAFYQTVVNQVQELQHRVIIKAQHMEKTMYWPQGRSKKLAVSLLYYSCQDPDATTAATT